MALSLSAGLFSMCLSAASEEQAIFDFDAAAAGELSDDWKVEGTNQEGPLATWRTVADPSAKSQPNVLELISPNRSPKGTYNICWNDSLKFGNGSIALRFKANMGMVDQGGGPVWRLIDKDNYYVCRANPLEDNFRLYYVKDGSRHQLASAKLTIPADEWHSIRVLHEGTHIECYLNGQKLFEVDDDTFTDPGYVGVWTKADAATSFDDIVVTD